MAKYDVTVTRIGSLSIEANSAEEALRLADGQDANDVAWIDGFTPTDVQEEKGC